VAGVSLPYSTYFALRRSFNLSVTIELFVDHRPHTEWMEDLP
jgi:hypothetical protein